MQLPHSTGLMRGGAPPSLEGHFRCHWLNVDRQQQEGRRRSPRGVYCNNPCCCLGGACSSAAVRVPHLQPAAAGANWSLPVQPSHLRLLAQTGAYQALLRAASSRRAGTHGGAAHAEGGWRSEAWQHVKAASASRSVANPPSMPPRTRAHVSTARAFRPAA